MVRTATGAATAGVCSVTRANANWMPTVGEKVELHSLRSVPALNGKLAVVVGDVSPLAGRGAGHLPVEILEGEAVKRLWVKSSNTRPVVHAACAVDEEGLHAVGLGDDAAVLAWLKGGGRANATYSANAGSEPDQYNLLTIAAQTGNGTAVDLLLQHGAHVNWQNNAGWTALMEAADEGYEKVVDILLRHGAATELQQRKGGTALILACFKGRERVVEELLRHGTDVNQPDDKGFTPLMLAAREGYARIVGMLLRHGAKPEQQATKGRTALSLATRECKREIEEHAVAEAARRGEALLAEIEAEAAEARAKVGKKGKKKKRKKEKKKGTGGGSGGAGAAQGSEAPDCAEAVDGKLTEVEEAPPAAQLEEGARLQGATRLAVEEQTPSVATPPEAEEPPDDFVCPITTEVMTDPVVAADGHAYERSAIQRWLVAKSTSPMTGETLVHSLLVPTHNLRRQIRVWQEACRS